jgi:deoxyribose-phosphate aldolase
MYLEYYINTIDEKDINIKKDIEELIKKTSNRNLVATPYYAKLIKKNFPKLSIGCFIDYPLSNADYNFRSSMIADIIKHGIDYINITVPFYYLVNRKYDKIREDIKQNIEAANGTEIRYILEYRKFDHQILTKICNILMYGGIKTIYPSTGFFIDNLEDNIIACAYLHKKTSINTIINGNCWSKKHCTNVIDSGMFGFSTNNLSSLKNIYDYE